MSAAKNWTVDLDWTPSTLIGDTLGMWYDASDTSTITESSGNVSQWDDKSGNGFHLTQGTGSYQPQTGTHTVNGLNVIRTQYQDRIENNAITYVFTNGVMAASMSMDITSGGVWEDHIYMDGPDSGEILKVRRNGNNLRLSYNYGLDGTSGSGNTSGSTFPQDTPNLVTQGHDSGTYTNYIDGTQENTHSISGTFNPDHFRAGWRSNGSPDVRHCEYVVVEDFSTAMREKVEGYLAHKWGQESKLPVAHPYKTNAPTIFD